MVDVETTGLGRNDRVVEIAVVEIDPDSGEVVDEFDTLVNPQRDIGPTGIHGITASMVSAAPTFDEIAGPLSRRLHGSVMAAHSLPFDTRLISQEMSRLGTRFDPGDGVCTLSLTSQKLDDACRSHRIVPETSHTALADARATAALLVCLLDGIEGRSPCRVGYVPHSAVPRTLRREPPDVARNDVQRVVSMAKYPFSDEALLHYANLLDWVLDDHTVTEEERAALRECASSWGIPQEEVDRVHEAYFQSIVAAAFRDGVITDGEHGLMAKVADALGLGDCEIPEMTEQPKAPAPFGPGTRVCFTGEILVDGAVVHRREMEAAAACHGLSPVSSVTKSGCDLLVAADTATSSAKAKKARSYAIPVISTTQFLKSLRLPGG